MKRDEKVGIVYVVDDDVSVRKAIGRLMRSSGFDVMEFASPEEFLAAPADSTPLCVLLDITMPGLTGLQVQERLNQRGTDWPIIAFSAREDDAARESARQLGAQLFLRKPVDAQALVDAISWVSGCKSNRKAEEGDDIAPSKEGRN